MSSRDIEDIRRQLEELMKETALRGSIRRQIMTLRRRLGNSEGERNIEDIVVKNLKNQGILERLIDHFTEDQKSCELWSSLSEQKPVSENKQSATQSNPYKDGHRKESDSVAHFSNNHTTKQHKFSHRKFDTVVNIAKTEANKQKSGCSNSASITEEERGNTNKLIHKRKKKRHKMSSPPTTEENVKPTCKVMRNSQRSRMLSNGEINEEKLSSRQDNNIERTSIENHLKKNKHQEHGRRPEVSFLLSSKDCDFPSLSARKSKVIEKKTPDNVTNSMVVKINPRKRHLHFEILGGKSFLDHLLEPSCSMFVLFLYFRGQRFWTQPIPCDSEPIFNEGFIFELHANELGNKHMADASQLLNMKDKVHIVLVRMLPSGEKVLVSSHFFEWRHILSCQKSQKTFAVELLGVGVESNITVGTIVFRLTLIPKLAKPLTDVAISSRLLREQKNLTEKDRIFLVYTKTWWKEYISLRPQHAQRTVKIFQQDENSQIRPVFHFVHVLRVGRPLLELPQEAVWFVSLVLLESSSLLGALPGGEQWWNPHTFLCLKKGGSENHATLLCSLFLGFGLDAYVCIGTKQGNIPWAWVATIGVDNQATFWESTGGGRYIHTGPSDESLNHSYPYKSIGCIFNHKSFYANIQQSDKVKLCNFNIRNKSLWKNMSEAAISSVSVNINISLMPGWTDPFIHSQEMESEMREQIVERRQDCNLPTRWDIDLCHLIAPLLAMYEIEHKMGHTIATDEINKLISKNIPEGFAFKALPMRIPPINKKRITGFCLQNSDMKSIIMCPEPGAKLALRVHTYVYPENVLSIWIIIACKFRTD